MEEWFYENLNELKKRFIIIMASLSVFTIFAFSFGVQTYQIDELSIPYPYFSIDGSVASTFFQKLKADLLPENVELIVTKPGDALFMQLGVSFFLGFVVALPILIHQIAKFITPALTRIEKSSVVKVLLSWMPLFIVGMVFSYVFIIPLMLNFLYGYVFALDVNPFLNINDFTSFVIQFIVAFGIIFTLPAIMGVLTAVGVKPKIWKNNWRYALGLMIIFGALITPDGSMVTLVIVAGPMIVLYAIGYVVSRIIYRKNQAEPSPVSSNESLISGK